MLLLTKGVIINDSLILLADLLLDLVQNLILQEYLIFHCYLFDLIYCLQNQVYQLSL